VDGVSIGGFSVGEPKDLTWEVLGRTTEIIPKEKARYLMGMGTPEDLWEAVGLGIDMTDCVWPTRVARHGQAMVRSGKLNLLNSALREDFSPLDAECACRVCKTHTRAYLSHLFRVKEISAFQLVSHHNVHFLMDLMRLMRRAIIEGRFQQAKSEFFAGYNHAR
jgi:queuine tRNA-ribosyltransferase